MAGRDQAGTGKSRRPQVSLVQAAARARVTQGRPAAGQELAVLVAVEFTGQRRR
jgi:hypothetical protein